MEPQDYSDDFDSEDSGTECEENDKSYETPQQEGRIIKERTAEDRKTGCVDKNGNEEKIKMEQVPAYRYGAGDSKAGDCSENVC